MSTSAAEAPVLQEVRGPSAFGGEFSRFWDLLRLVSVTEFRAQYANTVLGFTWTLIRPLIFFGVIFLVLREILRVGVEVEGYGASLVLSLILFTYFQDSTSRAVRSVSAREQMVRKMQFPRIVIPLSVSVTGALTMLLNLLAVFPLLLAFGLEPRWQWALFPLILLALAVLTTAVSMILSVLFVRFEDTAQAWNLAARLLFYVSPVLFPIEFVPGAGVFREIVAASPIALLLELARVWVVDPSAPGPVEAGGVWLGVVVPVVIFAGICAFAFWIFERDAPRIAEEL